MSQVREAVIVASSRTPLAKSFRGSFNQTRPDDLAAHCVKALVLRAKLDPATIDDVIVGAGIPEGPQGMNIGRIVAVAGRVAITFASAVADGRSSMLQVGAAAAGGPRPAASSSRS